VLRDHGFATVRPDGTRRLYAVRDAPLRDVDAWLDRFRRFWTPPLEALATELARGKRTRRAADSTPAPRRKPDGAEDARRTRDDRAAARSASDETSERNAP
jgi:hypothetical protein